ncbi:MAG TPA: protein kinase [Solirubrobacteraceae bacterium]|nr:protein kinase [Solirubrobacteraceae bacterium]
MSGVRVGTYEIVRMLARGGMAVVYLVHQPALDRDVVLKRLDLEGRDPALAQRFVREARLAATLDHPNIVTLFDFFEHDGVPYIAMEYVAGGSLRELVGRLSLPQVCGIVEGVLAGLGHAERQGIAHRDLKPENLLLTRRGNVKIADFGIARAYTHALTQRLTAPGMAIGTPAYMAPEQATNESLGPSTDLYSLGVIVYELLAGHPPFTTDTPVGLLYAHVHTPPPPLAALVGPPHAALAGWVEWLLAKDPAERPQSAAEAWDALEEVAVAEMGPYWRRTAAITAPVPAVAPPADAPGGADLPTTEESGPRDEAEAAEDRTIKLPTPTPLAPPAALPPEPVRRRRVAVALPAALALAGAVAVAAFVMPRDPSRTGGGVPPHEPSRTPAATPYDFNADGRQDLVIALLKGAPRGRRVHSGAVLVQARGKKPAWDLITEARAGLEGSPRPGDDFGSGLASADFDRDGHADLAIGTPGRERVSVIYGSQTGLDDGRVQQLKGGNARLPAGAGRYGYTIVARDLDDDGFGDLVVGAPGERDGQPRSGALHIVYGGQEGLDPERTRVIRRPGPGVSNFGQRLRTGDVDGDGKHDLAEGAPARGSGTGHATWCRSGERGPRHCRPLPSAGSTSALAIGDIDGDGYADIIQGDSQHVAPPLVPTGGGLVRVWMGSKAGPSRLPRVITQNDPTIPGSDEPGDEFGAVVEAGDVDTDGFDDMIVSAPREDAGAGQFTVIRGGHGGQARSGHAIFHQDRPNVPGVAAPDREFGSTLSVLRVAGDRRPDVVLAARGVGSADERVMVVLGGRGLINPDETMTITLPGVERLVDAPPGGRIRLARPAGS